MNILNVNMLNGISIRLGDNAIDDSKSRTQKTWLLLAYLIYYRSRTVPQAELYQLLWGDEESKDDPQNALRVMLHRSRALLDRLSPGTGSRMILRRKEGYQWAPEYPVLLDAEEFEQLCTRAAKTDDPAEKQHLYMEAASLYGQEFLHKHSGEAWARTLGLRYHDMYMNAVRELLQLLDAVSDREAAVELCRRALLHEPFSENLHYSLMRSLLKLGRHQEVIEAYEQVRELYANNFGTLPAEEIRRLYYEAVQDINDHTIPIDELYEKLSDDHSPGALICDYDFFKTVFNSATRMISRSGIAAHIAVLTICGKDGQDIPKRSLEYIMDCLAAQIKQNLRRGDVVTRCSIYQYAILLQLANYENSCMVCERVAKAYNRKYPHSPVEIKYSVRALEGTV